MNQLKILVLLFSIFAGCMLFNKKWVLYHRLLGEEPIRLMKAALDGFDKPGIALDLGPSISEEVWILLKNGWQVYAVDKFAQSLKHQERLYKDTYPNKLKTIHSDFAHVDWDSLPQIDFVWSSYALPFIEPAKIRAFWSKMISKIKSGGRFAGVAIYRGWYGDQQKEDQLFTREQIDQLFASFNVEYFVNWEESGQGIEPGNVKTKFAAFKVIAKKK